VTHPELADDEFIAIWNECRDWGEFSHRTGISADTAAHRATRLRKAGRHLKSYRRVVSEKELGEFLAELSRGTAHLSAREVLLLWFAGLPVARIAALSGRSENAVNGLVAKYRKRVQGIGYRRQRETS
jgi:hypothetical protein